MQLSSSAEELEPLVGQRDDEVANAIRVTVLAGGIGILGSAATELIVFTLDKIDADPTAFSETETVYCQCLLWIGWCLASSTYMLVIDRFGRKAPCYTLALIAIIAGIASTRATQVWFYGVAMFVVGYTLPPSGQIGFLLVQETVVERLRPACQIAWLMCYSLGLIIMAVLCWTVTASMNWRLETALWYLPMLVIVLMGIVFASESPAYTTRDKGSAATAEAAQGEGWSELRILLGEGLWRTTALTCVCWTGVCASYYGLSYSSENLSSNVYLNIILFSAVDIVSWGLTGPTLLWAGNKDSQVYGFLGSAVSLFLAAMMPTGSALEVGCALAARLCLNLAWSTVYLLIVECFPPHCRSAAIGVSNGVARLFTSAAPLCALVPTGLSYSVLAALCGAAMVATWLLDLPPGACEAPPLARAEEGHAKAKAVS
mmetsp:Transcript_47833/g.124056  ORF Transcript_47833/g.124056 Transcript_47833/m.124056 type:complete len:430 (+) Transcript_47833:128-1417(+)